MLLFYALLVDLSPLISGCQIWKEMAKSWDSTFFDQKLYQTPLPELLLTLGGGSPEKPSKMINVVTAAGRKCETSLKELPIALYGAGAARVDGGFVVCGGRTIIDDDNMNYPVMNRKLDEYSSLPNFPITPSGNPDELGTITMANSYWNSGERNKIFVFEHNTARFLYGTFDPERIKISWEIRTLGRIPKRPISGSCMAAIGNTLFFVGGITKDGDTSTHGVAFDISKDQVTTFKLDSIHRASGGIHGAACGVEIVSSSEHLATASSNVRTVGGPTSPIKSRTALLWVMGGANGEGRCSKHVALADLEQGHWLRMKAESHMDAFGGTFAALGMLRRRFEILLSCEIDSTSAKCACDASGNVNVAPFKWGKRSYVGVTGKRLENVTLTGKYASAVVPGDFFPHCGDASSE